jgi:hypothetical protein
MAQKGAGKEANLEVTGGSGVRGVRGNVTEFGGVYPPRATRMNIKRKGMTKKELARI